MQLSLGFNVFCHFFMIFNVFKNYCLNVFFYTCVFKSYSHVCADDVTAGSAGGGVRSEWTVARPSERHRPTAVLDNTADAGRWNTIHAGQKYTTTATATFTLRRLDAF